MTFLCFPLKSWLRVTFLGVFDSKCLPENWFQSFHDSQAVSRRLKSIQLMTQAAFQELTQNQLMTWVDSQVLIQIDSWLKIIPDSLIHISSWLKQNNVWFWVDSWFYSESYRCLDTSQPKWLRTKALAAARRPVKVGLCASLRLATTHRTQVFCAGCKTC